MNKDVVVVVDGVKKAVVAALPVVRDVAKTAAHAAIYSAVFTRVANWVNNAYRTKKEEE